MDSTANLVRLKLLQLCSLTNGPTDASYWRVHMHKHTPVCTTAPASASNILKHAQYIYYPYCPSTPIQMKKWVHQVSKMWPVYDLIIVMSAGILIRFLSGCVDAWKYAYVWCLNMQCRATVCIYLSEIHLNTCAKCAIFVQHKHAINEGTEACLPQHDHSTYISGFFVLYIFLKNVHTPILPAHNKKESMSAAEATFHQDWLVQADSPLAYWLIKNNKIRHLSSPMLVCPGYCTLYPSAAHITLHLSLTYLNMYSACMHKHYLSLIQIKQNWEQIVHQEVLKNLVILH